MAKEENKKLNKNIIYAVIWIIILIVFCFLVCSEKNLIGFQVKKILAENGNLDAQNKLGNMYFYGDIVERNYDEALKWYKMSAEKGNSSMCRNFCKFKNEHLVFCVIQRTE